MLTPIREAFAVAGGGTKARSRWDVSEMIRVEGREPLANRVKVCASLLTAKGWVDAYGNPTEAAPEAEPPVA